jgi:hypothetical protein
LSLEQVLLFGYVHISCESAFRWSQAELGRLWKILRPALANDGGSAQPFFDPCRPTTAKASLPTNRRHINPSRIRLPAEHSLLSSHTCAEAADFFYKALQNIRCVQPAFFFSSLDLRLPIWPAQSPYLARNYPGVSATLHFSHSSPCACQPCVFLVCSMC